MNEESNKILEPLNNINERTTTLTATDTTYVYCTKMITFNNSWTVAQFALIDLNGKMFYKGEHLPKGQSDYIDLNNLGIPYESKFKTKAIVDAGSDSVSSEIIVYRKDTSDIYYFLKGTTFDTTLYVGY